MYLELTEAFRLTMGRKLSDSYLMFCPLLLARNASQVAEVGASGPGNTLAL